jgi:hypothetical protein
MALHTKTSGLRPVRVSFVSAPDLVVRTAADPASLIARIRAEAVVFLLLALFLEHCRYAGGAPGGGAR